jgi:prepilin-type N-terminal cleavage/methylation domain-containing protein
MIMISDQFETILGHFECGMKAANKNQKRQKGFTLVEAMVGMTLVSMMIAGVMMAVPSITSIVKRAEDSQTAANLISNQVEYFRTHPFDILKTDVMPMSPVQTQTTINDQVYHIAWELKPYAIGSDSKNAIQATVTVTWSPPVGGKGPFSKTYWTVFSKNGISDKKFISAP